MSADINVYLNRITSEHRDKPNFIAMISLLVQPLADNAALMSNLPITFDIDVAVGSQLDIVGLWVGITRYLREPLVGVYFSFDTLGVGFDEGTWFGPFDPVSGLVALPDDAYRTLLKARIANNQWDGTIPSAYIFMDQVFPGDIFFIQDNGDMSMFIGVVGPVPLTAVTTALLTGGYLNIKPAGVRIAGYVTSTILGDPVFGFDADGPAMAGFDIGTWASIAPGV